MKKTIVLLGAVIVLVSSMSFGQVQARKTLEAARSEECVNEAQNINSRADELVEEVKIDVADRDRLNGQEIEEEVAVDAADEVGANTPVDQDENKEDEPITESEDEMDPEEPISEEPIAEETNQEEAVTEMVVEVEEQVVPEAVPIEPTETMPAVGSFSEIFIKEDIQLVENPDTVEEFESILLHMCATNKFTYSIEYVGVSFEELLTEETQQEIAAAFDSVFNQYPEYMSFSNRMTYRAKGDGNNVTLTFLLSSDTGMDAATLTKYREAFFVESLEIVGVLKESGLLVDGQSDREKAKVLFDWVIQHTEYDDDFHAESYTGYGVYANGLGVCQGYTAAYNALSKCAGLRVEGIGGVADGVDHIWTKALFAGEDVYIDATWGDSYVNSDASNYDYFLVDGETLAASHSWQ